MKNNTVNQRIVSLMKEFNHNYNSFAKELGISSVVVSNIAKGRNNPSFDFLQTIRRKYDWLSYDWLIDGVGEMKRNVSATSQVNEMQAEYGKAKMVDHDIGYLKEIIETQKILIRALQEQIDLMKGDKK